MADYTPSIVQEIDIRNMFSPPLDYDDITKAEILLKIEIVEDYVKAVYELTSAADARVPCILLVASKIIHNPSLAKKHYTLSYESVGDYSYSLAQPISRGTDVQSSPFVISRTWERMGLDMLEARAPRKRLKMYIVND